MKHVKKANLHEDKLQFKEQKALKKDFASLVFFQFMHKNQKKFCLSESEQIRDFGHFILLTMIVYVLCYVVYFDGGISFENIQNFNGETNIVVFFTFLLCHQETCFLVRDSVYMMKYVVNHPEEFTHPGCAFATGFGKFISLIAAEFVNLMRQLTQPDVSEVIRKYMAFQCIVNIFSIYLKVLDNR